MTPFNELFAEMSAAARMANAVRSTRRAVSSIASLADDRGAVTELNAAANVLGRAHLAAPVSQANLSLEYAEVEMAKTA
jgi:long-subunit fatty acid transport protein